jgi:hypothetical protein
MARDTEVTLEERYAGDPELLKFYKKKLLEPGWAGELKPYELAYIKSQLRLSPSLRRRWGFRPSAKRLSEKHIRAVARDGLSAIKKPVLASVPDEPRFTK